MLLEDGQLVFRVQAAGLSEDAPAISDVGDAIVLAEPNVVPQRANWASFRAQAAARHAPLSHLDSSTEDRSLWFHVAFVNFKSWHYTVQPLSYVAGSADRQVVLQVADAVKFFRAWQLFENTCDMKLPHAATLFQIDSKHTLMPREEIAPIKVWVRRFEDVPVLAFWQGEVRETAPPVRKPGRPQQRRGRGNPARRIERAEAPVADTELQWKMMMSCQKIGLRLTAAVLSWTYLLRGRRSQPWKRQMMYLSFHHSQMMLSAVEPREDLPAPPRAAEPDADAADPSRRTQQ